MDISLVAPAMDVTFRTQPSRELPTPAPSRSGYTQS
jgi:hypothetical protein